MTIPYWEITGVPWPWHMWQWLSGSWGVVLRSPLALQPFPSSVAVASSASTLGSSLSWMEGIQSLCQASKLHIVWFCWAKLVSNKKARNYCRLVKTRNHKKYINSHHQQGPSHRKWSARWPININPVSTWVFLQRRTIPAYQRNSVPAQSISIEKQKVFPHFWLTNQSLESHTFGQNWHLL